MYIIAEETFNKVRVLTFLYSKYIRLHETAIFGGGVPPASPNPDPISDQKMPFATPVFRPGFKNPYPLSDLTLYVIKHNR